MPRPDPDRLRRLMVIVGSVIALALLLAGWFLPYLLKRYIERNSEAWIDRRITIGSIVLNPFTGTYTVSDLVCYEPRSEQVFVSFKKLGVKGNVPQGLRHGHWRFREAELHEPYVHVHHRGDRLNFSDLLELGGAIDTTATDGEEVLFTVTDIALFSGRIDYDSDLLRDPLRVVDLGITCNLITSENGRMDFLVGLGLPDGTRLDGGFTIDTDSARYAVEAHLRDFDLANSLPYLQDFFRAGSLAGKLDIDLDVKQSYVDSSDLALSASMRMRDLALTDDAGEHLLAVQHLSAVLDTLHGERFQLGVVDIDGMDLRFALLSDGTDNWTRLLDLMADTTSTEEGAMVLDASGTNYFVLFGGYVAYLGEAVTTSAYSADSLSVRNARVLYEDHSTPRSFRYVLDAIDLRAQRFDASSTEAPMLASMRLNGVGALRAHADFDPHDLRNVVINLQVDSLMLPHLDPYVRWYAAHPMEEGVLRYRGTTTIQEGIIDSRNAIHIDRLRFGRKVDEHDPEIYVLPLRLAAGLLKDVKGMVDLDVPVQGDLRDPSFKVWPIVWQVLKNLVVKAAAAPYEVLANAFDGADEQELEEVRYRELQMALDAPQRRTVQQLAKALQAKPELRVDLVPVTDSLAEAGALALFHAKGRYLMPGSVQFTAGDSARIADLAAGDSLFVRWMDEQAPDTKGLSMPLRCMGLLGKGAVLQQWNELEQVRQQAFLAALQEAGTEPDRSRVRTGSPAEVAPYLGNPGYRFVYDVFDR